MQRLSVVPPFVACGDDFHLANKKQEYNLAPPYTSKNLDGWFIVVWISGW